MPDRRDTAATPAATDSGGLDPRPVNQSSVGAAVSNVECANTGVSWTRHLNDGLAGRQAGLEASHWVNEIPAPGPVGLGLWQLLNRALSSPGILVLRTPDQPCRPSVSLTIGLVSSPQIPVQ
jgi:hypothetical protein